MLSLIPIIGPGIVVFAVLLQDLIQSGSYPPEINALLSAVFVALLF